MTDAIDLFAGPGGWDLAALALDVSVLGVEWDDAACATRESAGLRTLQADVSALNPLGFAPVDLLIGSPPCPTFSRAGRGAGRHLTQIIVACLRALADGRDGRAEAREAALAVLRPVAWAAEQEAARKKRREPSREKAEASAQRDATMSVLVVEPLRWALAMKPRLVALEQVPDVLPLWKVVAELLEQFGYSTWSGVLEAERYGVPQTRERAVLMARSDGVHAHPPHATHQRYDPKVPRLDGPELTLEGEILPWVSMADALAALGCWEGGPRPRPAPTVTGGGTETGGPDVFASAAAREVANAAITWKPTDVAVETGNTKGGTRSGLIRSAGEPSRTIDSRADQIERRRTVDDPATTITGGRRCEGGLLVGRQLPPGEDRSVGGWSDVPEDDPRRTGEWVGRRPSTTVNGDPRISAPGHHDPKESGSQQRFAVRVTEQEAGILQTFPADYPWQGTRSKRYQQIGNAVPPLLAFRILEALLDREPLVIDPPPASEGTGRALDRRQGGAPMRRDDQPAHTLSSSGLANGRDVWVPPGGQQWQSPSAGDESERE